jgi:5-methylcytosine-specific restriction endonuclease McrA
MRTTIHNKYNGRCAYCGKEITIKQMHIDHIHPRFLKHHLIDKDINDIENLNPACAPCNLWKSTYTIEEFRRQIEMQVGRLRNHQGGFRLAERFNQIHETGEPVIFWFER